MAGALRPVVILMLLASLLFVAAGIIDGAYPGGRPSIGDLAALSYLFALINTLVAVLVARGSEQSLALRMGLSLFFVAERPLSAFLIGPKTSASVAVHLSTALAELFIFVSAFRVWRLGHSVPAEDIEELFSLEAVTAAAAPRGDEGARSASAPEVAPRRSDGRASWPIAVLSLLLAATFVADGIVSGFVPGGRVWGASGDESGWLVYLFAVVTLAIAARAVHGGRLALRLLTATALIFFLERAFSPFALRVLDPLALALHGLAVFVALALALAAAGAIRSSRASASSGDASLEAA